MIRCRVVSVLGMLPVLFSAQTTYAQNLFDFDSRLQQQFQKQFNDSVFRAQKQHFDRKPDEPAGDIANQPTIILQKPDLCSVNPDLEQCKLVSRSPVT